MARWIRIRTLYLAVRKATLILISLSSVVTLHWSLNAFSTDSPMKHEATFILTSMGYFDPVRIFIAKLTLSCKTMYTYLKA